MRFVFLSILLLVVCSPFSLGFTTDAFYIETVIADSVIILDSNDFNAFAGVFTKDFVFQAPSLGLPPAKGSQQLIAEAFKLFPNGILLQNAITTQRIAFVGPTDENYQFTRAKVITYLTTTFFGTGNLTGQIVAVYSRLDDTLTKTSLPNYAGWRVSERDLSAFGTAGNLAILPPGFRK
ncbi:hypothetical protein MMC07_003752 [Pseudocyphellaria aurata]|nr:hypothetical protein [Pseudocyphellaria aurata]